MPLGYADAVLGRDERCWHSGRSWKAQDYQLGTPPHSALSYPHPASILTTSFVFCLFWWTFDLQLIVALSYSAWKSKDLSNQYQ